MVDGGVRKLKLLGVRSVACRVGPSDSCEPVEAPVTGFGFAGRSIRWANPWIRFPYWAGVTRSGLARGVPGLDEAAPGGSTKISTTPSASPNFFCTAPVVRKCCTNQTRHLPPSQPVYPRRQIISNGGRRRKGALLHGALRSPAAGMGAEGNLHKGSSPQPRSLLGGV